MTTQIAKFWQIFKKTPIGHFLRWVSPQWLVNLLEHWPIAILANLTYGFPSKKITVIGVTGTDGKTTTVNMIYQILKESGKSVSMVSTINAVIGGEKYDTGFHTTSPHSFYIQEFIKKAYQARDDFIILEVTSHALDQHRFNGVKFDIGVITNITHEHLDYHKSFENYRAAKAKLLKMVKWAVLNLDDPNFNYLTKKTSGSVISFGLSKKAHINPQIFPLSLKIPGNYNILNALAAASVGEVLGIDRKTIRESLENFTGLEGRMEEIKNSQGIKIVVDFAHTPNALEQALKTLKDQQGTSKLIAVFGCASERDLEKRPKMGEVSSRLADVTILTDEDPRFEDSMKIISEISKGGKFNLGKNLFEEPDRLKAIELAVSLAKKGDTVGIFGKGHEKSMNYRGVEKPWSDQEALRKVLGGRKA